MHCHDALRQGLVGGGGADRPSLELYRSCVGRIHASDDLSERRFTRAVLAYKAANAASDNGKIDAA